MVAKEQQVSAQAAKPERPDAGSKGKTAKKAKSSDGPPKPDGTVIMKAPNGQTKAVSADQVDHYKAQGATVVTQ